MDRWLIVSVLVAGLAVLWLAWQGIKLALRRSIPSGPAEPAGGRPALLYFSGPDCAPCRLQQGPVVAGLRESFDGRVRIEEHDAIAQPELAARYRVLTVPTTVVLAPDGEVVAINYGVTPAAKLRRQLEHAMHDPSRAGADSHSPS